MSTEPSFLSHDGVRIAYHHFPAVASGARLPGVVFLGGFMSDMEGGKALHLEATCRDRGQQFTRLDYRGHGQSGGAFAEACISDWASDAAAVIQEVCRGPQILVGSSMGGWIMMLLAKKLSGLVGGLVGIAPAPDFVLRMEEALTDQQKYELEDRGFTTRPTEYSDEPYIISKKLLDDGKQNLVLTGASYEFAGPVRLLHGLKDDAVPWEHSLTIAEKITSDNVQITFVKRGDHRLSEEDELEMLDSVVLETSRLAAIGQH